MELNTGTHFISDFDVDSSLDWQMSRAEKCCLINILKTLKPEVSIEIGTYKGGSLQVISKYSNQVYSIDISAAPMKFLENKFSNVLFRIGDSKDILHKIFKEIDDQNKQLGFILVDGDHSKKGVSRDINTILSYPHKHPVTIIMHDSFNPQCRSGMKSVDYAKFRMVEYVELDYITGSFSNPGVYREMWGGIAMIKINPQKKDAFVQVFESQKKLFKSTRMVSLHLIKDPLKFLVPFKKYLYKLFGKKHKLDQYFEFEK